MKISVHVHLVEATEKEIEVTDGSRQNEVFQCVCYRKSFTFSRGNNDTIEIKVEIEKNKAQFKFAAHAFMMWKI